MKILFFSQWFQPEPFFKGLSFVTALKERGHDVEVLTGFPNYPGGRVYDGYRIGLYKIETMSDIRVVRVALYPSHDKSGLKRMANYGSFALSACIFGPWLIKKPDVIYTYHPPGTIGLPAWVLKRLTGARVVYDIQDLWPDSIGETGMMSNSRILRTLDRYMRWVYRVADRIVVLSPGFKRLLVQRGVPEEKIDVVYNWCDEKALTSDGSVSALPEQIAGLSGFSLLFAGTMGHAQGLDAVLDAAKISLERGDKVTYVFVGGGIDRSRLEQRSKDMSLTNVVWVPAQPPNLMPPIFESVSAVLVHLQDRPLFEITIPSKIQAYLAAGKPVLAAVRGDAADLIASSKAGFACPPEDAAAIANAAATMSKMSQGELEEMGQAARKFYRENLSMDRGIDQIDTIFKEAVPVTK